jgi:hypothetical protein
MEVDHAITTIGCTGEGDLRSCAPGHWLGSAFRAIRYSSKSSCKKDQVRKKRCPHKEAKRKERTHAYLPRKAFTSRNRVSSKSLSRRFFFFSVCFLEVAQPAGAAAGAGVVRTRPKTH